MPNYTLSDKDRNLIENLKNIISNDSVKSMWNSIYHAKQLQALELKFLHIAINEEENDEKLLEYAKRIINIAEDIDAPINAIIVDKVYNNFLNSTGVLSEQDNWNQRCSTDSFSYKSPSNHIVDILKGCVDTITDSTKIPSGTKVKPISIAINLLATKESILQDLTIVTEAILCVREDLKSRRPDLFPPESKKSEVKKTRTPQLEINEIEECLSILQMSIASGKTTSELSGHQPPNDVILRFYNKILTADDENSGRNHSAWDSCRYMSRKKLDKALKYLDLAKRNTFPF